MKFLRTISLIAITLSICWSARAQELDADYYTYPLLNTKRYYSSNFGEMRPNHFHSGVDFKTDGVEGRTVVAAADGYISRIFQSPWGFGLALYITHPNGTTTVYAHLQKFRDDIAAYVYRERHRLKRHNIDLYCGATTFPVKKGDMIALSGNSGSSAGPHLHFEIRSSANQKTLNMISKGVYQPTDDIAPLIDKIHYFEVDTVAGVPRHSEAATYELKADGTLYSLEQEAPISVGRKGYFVVEVSDRKNGTTNRYGVHNIVAQVDGQTYYEYRNDGFLFGNTRYCNAIAYYPIQHSSRNEAMRLAELQHCIKEFYPHMVDKGVVRTEEGQQRKVRIYATDDCLNTSTLEFEIVGKPDSECFSGEAIDKSTMVYYHKATRRSVDDVFSVDIPALALYESTDIITQVEEGSQVKTSLIRPLLTKVYSVGNKDIPLHKSMTISFRYTNSDIKPQQLAIASVNDKQEMVYVGGKYKDGVLSVKTSTFGQFCVTCDATAPTITPKFKDGDNLSSSKRIEFQLKDNFSGVDSYSATIDGKWVAIDYAKGIASINLIDEGIKGGVEHSVTITVSDACGNKASWSGKFLK